MKRAVELSLLSAVSWTLIACGSGAKLGGGKEGAAQALFQMSQAAGQAQGNNMGALRSGADASYQATVSCAKKGKATLKLDASNAATEDAVTFVVTYDECSQDGKNSFDGTMTISMAFEQTSATSFNMSMRLKGSIEIEGEIDDSITADITQTVDFSKLSSTSGTVTVHLSGTIQTDEHSYTYENEPLTITVSELPAEGRS